MGGGIPCAKIFKARCSREDSRGSAGKVACGSASAAAKRRTAGSLVAARFQIVNQYRREIFDESCVQIWPRKFFASNCVRSSESR